MTRWPDFLVAGSPKCGTTAVHSYLRRQRGVFVPLEKEPNYFSRDVRLRKSKTREEYLALFERAPSTALVGEVSVWYLYSREAARAILKSCGKVKIVAMLRNPVEATAALHAQLVLEGDEPITDLEAALEANRNGSRPDISGWKGRECLDYERVYSYSEQLERFLELFGRERVHVVLFDDWRRDTRAAYEGLCDFLGIEASPGIDYAVVNPHKRVTRPRLRDWSRRSNRGLRALGRVLLPGERLRQGVRRPLARVLKSAYTRVEPRAELPEGLRNRLVERFAPDVERLSSLTGRDLSHWLEVAESA